MTFQKNGPNHWGELQLCSPRDDEPSKEIRANRVELFIIMLIQLLATLIRAAWVSVEVHYVRRFMVQPRKDWDKHSGRLWDIANALEPTGMILGFTGIGRIRPGGIFAKSMQRSRNDED